MTGSHGARRKYASRAQPGFGRQHRTSAENLGTGSFWVLAARVKLRLCNPLCLAAAIVCGVTFGGATWRIPVNESISGHTWP